MSPDQNRTGVPPLSADSGVRTPDARVILVRFSPELLSDMEGEWSEPVQVRPVRQDDGTWELEARQWREGERKGGTQA